jgi:para-aminobenzoate synthetase / 4-amino-4-deoxychorismate lyase
LAEVLTESWPVCPMTPNILLSIPPDLSGMTARPYRVALASDTSPAAVIAQLDADDHPGALWGDWFGGGLLIFRRPIRVLDPVDTASGFGCLDEQPAVIGSDPDSPIVGGG